MYSILSPLRNELEIQELVKNGAGEFYCGFVFDGDINLNDRPNNIKFNFNNLQSLSAGVRKIHSLGKKVYLTLNSTKFSLSVFDNIYSEILNLNVDAFIISDLFLLDYLNNKKCRVKIHLSTIIGISNFSSISYFINKYNNLNITRVCLERTIDLLSIKKIIEKSHLEIEFFIFSGNCKYSEGYCNIHKYSTKYSKEKRVNSNKVRCSYHCMQLKDIDKVLNKNINSSGISCGMCSLSKLNNYLIKNNLLGKKLFLKIAGRGYDSNYKFKIVSNINDFLSNGLNNGPLYYKNIVGNECLNTHNCTY